MKKIETSFVCDDCGAPLPTDYIGVTSKGDQYFKNHSYNSAHFQVNTDCWIHVDIDMEVVVDYGGTYKDLCPKCRVKWLKKALGKFEEELSDE